MGAADDRALCALAASLCGARDSNISRSRQTTYRSQLPETWFDHTKSNYRFIEGGLGDLDHLPHVRGMPPILNIHRPGTTSFN
jgi:hypothetical protein